MDLLLKLLPGEGRLDFGSVAIEAEAQQITVEMMSKAAVSDCPVCGIASQRQHSRYVRRVNDMPWADFSVVIELAVGKWFCPNPDCKRHIFTERLPGVVQPWARRTERLAAVQTQLGLTVGGRAGSCLGEVLHSIVSKDSLIRLIRRHPLAKYDTPRVLGIDDWAKRKGQSYGTILVDLESHQVVDVLPERSAACVEAWLKAHPGVEVISRDRGGEYAAGARAGAPEAMQVADRFHLLKNLGEALTQALKQHSRELRAIVVTEENATLERPIPIAVNITEKEEVPPPPAPPRTARKAISLQKQAARRALYDQVCALADNGWMQKTIATELHLSAKTVSRWLAAADFPERQPRAYQPRLIEPYIPYLCQRWAAGCRNGAQLRREIEAQGYQAGTSGVAEFIAELRHADGLPSGSHALTAAVVKHPLVLTPRLLTTTLFKPTTERSENQTQLLQRVIEQLPSLRPLLDATETFIKIVRERLSTTLDDWLDRAAAIPGLKSFVNGIRQDYAAVSAALSTEYSNGQVEGHVNRLKFIKRQGYGRANFDLLRRRVLLAGA